MYINLEVKATNISESLDYSEALELVKLIDVDQIDADFTKECAQYFVQELIKLSEPGDDWTTSIREMLK